MVRGSTAVLMVFWQFFTMAGLVMGLRQVQFSQYASGEIDSANLTQPVDSLQKCAVICRKLLVCSAFSMTYDPEDGYFQCSIVFGDFTWTANPNSSLFMEDIGSPDGYKLALDGRFYKMHNVPTLTTQFARELCQSEDGDLAVDYPEFRRSAIDKVLPPPAINATYYVGISLNGASTWLTDDGLTFKTNKSDPAQVWSGGQPYGSNGFCVWRTWIGWFDEDCGSADRVACRKDIIYTRSAANGKYYKLHNTRVNASTAAEICASEGGTLANWYKSADWDATVGYRIRNGRTSNWTSAFFVGGSDRVTDGTWVLPDGSTFNVINKATDLNQRWIQLGTPGFNAEPDGGASASNVVYIAGGLADTDDSTEARFLCEIPV